MISIHSEYSTLKSADLISTEAPTYVLDARIQEFCNCWSTSFAAIEWMLELCSSESLHQLFAFKYLVAVASSRADEFEQDLKTILPVLESKYGFTAANNLVGELRKATQGKGGTDVSRSKAFDFDVEPWRWRLLVSYRDFVLSELSRGNVVTKLPSLSDGCRILHRRKDDVRRFLRDFQDTRYLQLILCEFIELFRIYVECPDSKSRRSVGDHSKNGRSLYGKPITEDEKDRVHRYCRRLCDSHPHAEISLITCTFSGNSALARVASVSNADFAAREFERELCETLGLSPEMIEMISAWEFGEFEHRYLHLHAFLHVPSGKSLDKQSIESVWSSIIKGIESRCGINPQLNDNGLIAPVDVHVQFPEKSYGYRWTRGGQKYLAKDEQKHPPKLYGEFLHPASWSHISSRLRDQTVSEKSVSCSPGVAVDRVSIYESLRLFRERNGLPEPVSNHKIREKILKLKQSA